MALHFVDGAWAPTYLRVPLGDARAVTAEAEAQLEAFLELMGCSPSHIDSHQHWHNEEPLRSVALRLARRVGVPLRHHSSSVRYLGNFYGQDEEGTPLPELLEPSHLAAIIRSLEPGKTELCCHPASALDFASPYSAERLLELRTLCDPEVARAIRDEGITLRSFQREPFRES